MYKKKKMELPLPHCYLLLSLLLLSCWLYAPVVDSFRISRMINPSSQYRLQMLRLNRPIGLDSSSVDPTRGLSSRGLKTSLPFKVSERDVEVRPKLVVEDEDYGDDEEDNELVGREEGDGKNSQVFLRRLSRGVIPIAASVGFAVTPSSNIASRIAGAAAGGVAGFIAKRVIDKRLAKEAAEEEDEEEVVVSIPPSIRTAMFQMKRSGLAITTFDLNRIEMIAKRSQVDADDLGLLFVHVLAEAVFDTVRQDSVDLMDLSELMDFIDTVGFAPSEIADGFALAATMVGSQLTKTDAGFYTSNYPVEVLQQAAKIFFLADKFIGTFEGYYGKRMLLGLTYFLPEDYQEVITESCTKLFLRCVESVLANPSSFTTAEIDRLKTFITTSPMVSDFRPANMQKVITEAFLVNVDKNLELSQASNSDAFIGNMDNYLHAKDILGWDERELLATIRTKTKPVFATSCKGLFNEVLDHPDRAEALGDKLRQQMEALQISKSIGKQQVVELIQGLNNDYLLQMEKVYNASDRALEPVFKIMVSYTLVHESLSLFSQHLFSSTEEEGSGVPIPALPFVSSVRLDMYQMALEKKKTDGKVVIDDMFVLTEGQKKMVQKTMSLPKVASWLQQVISEKQFNADAKAAYQKMLKDYEVEDEEWKPTSLEFYYREASRVGNLRAIPSMEDMDYLREVREFLNCDDSQVTKVHLDVFGEKYVKALEDSMNPTGVIGDDYVDGLSRLQQRLGLSLADVEVLTGAALQSRMKPMMENLVDIFKSNTDVNYRREKERKSQDEEGSDTALTPKRDKSLDPISSMDNVFGFMEMDDGASTTEKKTYMREVVNLVDLVAENFEVQGIEDIRSKEMLPLNAVRMVNETDLLGMYKHFLISRLSEANEDFRTRYEQIEPFFIKLLGVPESNATRVKESVAYSAYVGLLRQSLQYKERIERQDIQQFAILKEKLPLSDEAAEYIFHEASVDAALQHGQTLFLENDGGSFTLTPAQARRYREQIQSLGLEMREDLKFVSELLSYLFALEVKFMIENDQDDFADLQEAYELPEERAMEIVEESCKRYISQQLNLALRSAKRYEEVDCIKWTADIMKYANYVTGSIDADGSLFTDDDKRRLISFFVAELESSQETVEGLPEGETAATYAAEKLREMIHLTPKYKAPVDGIQGILGNTKSMKELLRSNESTAQKKKQWAWG